MTENGSSNWNGPHLWLVDLAGHDPALEVLCGDLLSPGELARRDRLVRDEDRRRFAVSRALVRVLLARKAGRAPGSLDFAAGAHGKPRLVDGGSWRFNLSHAGERCLVGIARGAEIGVDVERVDGRLRPDDVADALAPAERAALVRLPEAERGRGLLRLWTLKEAVLKAVGVGLLAPEGARAAEIAIGPGEPPRIARLAPSLGAPPNLAVHEIEAGPAYAAAWAGDAALGPARLVACRARDILRAEGVRRESV